MKTIELKTVYRDGDDQWEDGGGNPINVVLDDSDPDFHALLIDGVQHLAVNIEPFIHWQSYGMQIGYTCFEPSPGVKYRAVVDGQDVGGGLAAITHNGQWYDVTESCRFNGIIVAGADLKSQTATV